MYAFFRFSFKQDTRTYKSVSSGLFFWTVIDYNDRSKEMKCRCMCLRSIREAWLFLFSLLFICLRFVTSYNICIYIIRFKNFHISRARLRWWFIRWLLWNRKGKATLYVLIWHRNVFDLSVHWWMAYSECILYTLIFMHFYKSCLIYITFIWKRRNKK